MLKLTLLALVFGFVLPACVSGPGTDGSRDVRLRDAGPRWTDDQIGSTNVGKSEELNILEDDVPDEPDLDDRIRDILYESMSESADSIDIETRDGHVILIGTVSTNAEKTIIEEDVLRVEGVATVDNRLQVMAH